ncbi:MAG: hypothetical protein Q8R90_07180 [Bacteroidales bacterium]|jgi:hypothetical protein|nr:hypothetical protein [Bacteroidales bacterium]
MGAEKHLLSDPAEWMTSSEFVDKEGKIKRAIGEAKIIVNELEIINETWSCVEGKRICNCYRIEKESDHRYRYECNNPELGTQRGDFNIDRNIVYSKFTVNETSLNGFEIIVQDDDECTIYGTLYEGSELLNSWRTVMVKIQ